MITTIKNPILKERSVLLRTLSEYVDKEIHLKIEGDEGPNLYVLKEVNKDCIVVYAAQFQRIVPMNRILFIQINEAPIGVNQWRKKVSF